MLPALNIVLGQKSGLVRRGLAAFYRFDEGAGQLLTDYSGNGNHGQLGSTSGSDTNDPTWAAEGLSFDDTNDAVLTPLDLSGEMTLILVVNRNAGSANQDRLISDNTANLAFYFEDDFAKLWNGSAVLATGGTTADAVWHFVYAKQIGPTGYIGVNKAAPTTGAYTMPTFTDLRIGADSAYAHSMGGKIAAVALYRVGLSQDEINKDYDFLKRFLSPRGVVLP